jgi:hypothetical protein
VRFCVACVLFLLLLIVRPRLLWADGGTLQLSQRCGDFQVSVFTSPAGLRCGAIDISVLVQDVATGMVRADVPVTVQMTQAAEKNVDRPTAVLSQTTSTAAATNKLFQAAVFDVPQPGTWLTSVSLEDREPLTFELAVSPPLPAWMEIAPWFGWPFAAVVLFVVHQGLVSNGKTGKIDQKSNRSARDFSAKMERK